MLAMHPEHQEKVYDEICSIFSNNSSRDVTAEDLSKFEFTDRFIKETMRLLPTVPFLTRHAKGDLKLSSSFNPNFLVCTILIEKLYCFTANYLVPHGSELTVGIYHTHHNKEIWGPNADKFNPDNFLPENIKNKHPYAFIPFSAGARNCIGKQHFFG